MFYYVSMSSRGARPSDMSGSLSPAPNTASIIFILHAPLSASSHVFHLFSSNLSRSDGLAPSRNALPPLFTLLSFGSGFRVQGSRFRWRLRRLFLEDGVLVSQPSPLGNAIKLSGRTFLAPHRGELPRWGEGAT